MSKHTPGPWILQRGTTENGKPFWVRAVGGLISICYFIGHIEDEANAQLVSAAPDMIDALKAAYIDHPERKWESCKMIVRALEKAGVGIPAPGEPFT